MLKLLKEEAKGRAEPSLDSKRVHTKPHLPEEGEGCKSSYQDRFLLSIHSQVPKEEEKG